MDSTSHKPGDIVIQWLPPGLSLQISLDDQLAPCIDHVLPASHKPQINVSPHFASSKLPLNGVRVAGQGHTTNKTAKSMVGGVLSSRLHYRHHVERKDGVTFALDIVSYDNMLGIEVTHTFEVFAKVPVLRSWSTLRNKSSSSITVMQASSLSIGGMTNGTRSWSESYSVWSANNTWFREAQWQEKSLPDVGIDDVGLFELNDGHRATMARFSVSNQGSLSTETHLPMGAVTRNDGQDTWLWQIEHNGSWRWEIGDWQDGLYMAAGGPSQLDHAWEAVLRPGETFTSVPIALCHVVDCLEEAFATLTEYRRCLLHPHVDYERLPIIFNDYMNCLMGDPTEEKIHALLEPVRGCGAEYFVIDAGWYADDSNWWDDVGAWEPSQKRFPSGFKALLDAIRAKGLIPGLWLEPEVVGIRSVVAKQLPNLAFFQQRGQRVEERGRYQLDFSQILVREHLDRVVDRLVHDFGVGYFKFDYNIDVMTGTDADVTRGISTGAAHLAHHRAYLQWVKDLLSRHDGLVIENCSSGGQRMDYAMLSVHTLQSTSDQQDPLLYAAIAAACPTAVVPEQGASWAYPQRQWSDETNVVTMINSLLGRVHLSGKLDDLEPAQYELVRQAMQVYHGVIREKLCTSRPFWPLGIPRWHDEWIALGLATVDGTLLLAVWRRSGSTKCSLALPKQHKNLRTVSLLYPTKFEAEIELEEGGFCIELPAVPCARLLQISP